MSPDQIKSIAKRFAHASSEIEQFKRSISTYDANENVKLTTKLCQIDNAKKLVEMYPLNTLQKE